MVWGGISLEGRTDLHVIANGTLTAVRYRDEILRAIVRPYAGAVGPGFLLVQDNARPHVARELTDALIQVWEEIPRRLIRSMPRHCRECVQARRGHTHY
ncbi:hypothetical protein SKAU_G00078280 [Synaphobranchus kaupii]|uniref:Transposase n=1 Tax=Synaphobranchus kaupii TaxID=118154 RepID=A0A9Q1J320_SYNKA|nr:hypothetical protein SKAU_G00078280 [Synaphobranchus kaupii]